MRNVDFFLFLMAVFIALGVWDGRNVQEVVCVYWLFVAIRHMINDLKNNKKDREP